MIARNPVLRAARRAAAIAVALAWLATLASAATTPGSKPGPGAPSPRPAAGAKKPAATSAPARTTPSTKAKLSARAIYDQAFNARQLEDAGAYGRAAEALRALRRHVKLDADLEIQLALDEARSGHVDSALARLSSPLLLAASTDSMPLSRRSEYPYQRETYWLNGKFDGWHWYVVRARAELEARKGRWQDAAEWARKSVEAWPLSGKDWHILAVCAARAGAVDEARAATAKATLLDPALPEARYLAGLWAWRDGKRNEAAGLFRQAMAIDSSYAPPALALVRVRLPGSQPDTLPGELLTGVHQVALLTSPLGPKPEEFVQVDVPASLDHAPDEAVVDSLLPGVKPMRLNVSVLVDENGYPVLNHLPWFEASKIDFRKVIRILASTPAMRFTPAQLRGRPQRLWVSLEYDLNP